MPHSTLLVTVYTLSQEDSQPSTALSDGLVVHFQVGASNELPESEELDALYDRFLIRRSVSQVSSSQLGNLARLAAGTKLVAQSPSNGAGNNGAGAPAETEAGPGLDLEDFRSALWFDSRMRSF